MLSTIERGHPFPVAGSAEPPAAGGLPEVRTEPSRERRPFVSASACSQREPASGSTRRSQCAGRQSRGDAVKSLSPHPRFLIALHSPDGVAGTGLCVCPPEKNARKAWLRCSAGHFLRCGFEGDRRIAAISRNFAGNAARVSLQPRLCGGEIEIRTFVTFCAEPLRADVCATCNGFCNIHVSSGELLQHSNRENSPFSYSAEWRTRSDGRLKVARF